MSSYISTDLRAALSPKVATANKCKHREVLYRYFSLLFRHPWNSWHSLSFSLLIQRWPDEEGRPWAAAVAQSLRHRSVQEVDQQEDRLAVGRHSVGERRPCVERRTDVRELGLWREEKQTVMTNSLTVICPSLSLLYRVISLCVICISAKLCPEVNRLIPNPITCCITFLFSNLWNILHSRQWHHIV